MTKGARYQDATGIFEEEPNDGIRQFAAGPGRVYTAVPADGQPGFKKGCLCYDETSGATGTGLYFNEGTNTSCSFRKEESQVSLAQAVGVPITDVRTPTLTLPTSATAGVVGITAGTFGTAAPLLISEAGASKADIGRFLFKIPQNYNPGGAISFVFSVKEITATDGTIEFSAYNAVGTIGSDLAAFTSSVALSTTPQNITVPLTTTGLVGGQVLDCELTLTTVSSGTISVLGITALVDLLN